MLLVCRKKIFDLVDGDTILDNGACVQLITRTIRSGPWHKTYPLVSKKEFLKFKNDPNVSIDEKRSKDNLIYYVYRK